MEGGDGTDWLTGEDIRVALCSPNKMEHASDLLNIRELRSCKRKRASSHSPPLRSRGVPSASLPTSLDRDLTASQPDSNSRRGRFEARQQQQQQQQQRRKRALTPPKRRPACELARSVGEEDGPSSDDGSGNHLVCPVCLDDIEVDEIASCPCSHAFHASCVKRWIEVHPSCPSCRIFCTRRMLRTTSGDVIRRKSEDNLLAL